MEILTINRILNLLKCGCKFPPCCFVHVCLCWGLLFPTFATFAPSCLLRLTFQDAFSDRPLLQLVQVHPVWVPMTLGHILSYSTFYYKYLWRALCHPPTCPLCLYSVQSADQENRPAPQVTSYDVGYLVNFFLLLLLCLKNEDTVMLLILQGCWGIKLVNACRELGIVSGI